MCGGIISKEKYRGDDDEEEEEEEEKQRQYVFFILYILQLREKNDTLAAKK